MNRMVVTGFVVVAGLGAVACGSSGKPATAAKGDRFCTLAATAVSVGDSVDTSGDPAKLEAGVTAAVAADKAAQAVAPKDFVDLGQKAIDQEEKLIALLQKYKWDFTATIASADGKALLSNTSDYSDLKAERDAYLKQKCAIAPPDNTSDASGIKLAAGVEGLQQFFSILQINQEFPITDEQVSCLVADLTGKISDADLQALVDHTDVSAQGEAAFGQAFSDCGVNIAGG